MKGKHEKAILAKVRKLPDKDLALIVRDFEGCHCTRIREREIDACKFQPIRKKLGSGKCGAWRVAQTVKETEK